MAIRSAHRGLVATSLAAVAALSLLLTGCVTTDPEPTGSSSSTPTVSPSPTTPSEWGEYPGLEQACMGVADDVIAMSLVPNNLGVVDSEQGIADIVAQIGERQLKAPVAVRAMYGNLADLVRDYGFALREYEDQKSLQAGNSAEGSSSPSADPSSSASASAAASATATPTPAAEPQPPVFDTAAYDRQLTAIKAWLNLNCGGA